MDELPVIDTRADPAAQRIADLAKPSRGAPRTALVEDVEPLLQALRAGVEVVEVYGLVGSPVPPEVLAECATRGVPVRLLDAALATDLFRSEKRPRLFGVIRVPRPARLADLAASQADVVVLDGVRIVGNIGAIVRTCYALGAAGLVLVDSDLATVVDRRLVRASRGYVFSLPVVLATVEQARQYLPDAGLVPVVLDAGGSSTLAELAQTAPRAALVLGSEKRGAGALAGPGALTLGIPMDPGAESLNVSVSAGIALAARASRNLGLPRVGR